jgi:hypothetical protein
VALYEAWLKDEEEEWRNDCQVCGRIFAEGWEEKETATSKENADETGSDYDRMIAIIEEVDEPIMCFTHVLPSQVL